MSTDPARAALAELVAFLDADLSAGSRERGRGIWAAARAALAQPVQGAPVARPELGDRFMEILRSIHGPVLDDVAESARLAFVHALKEAQPATPLDKHVRMLADISVRAS